MELRVLIFDLKLNLNLVSFPTFSRTVAQNCQDNQYEQRDKDNYDGYLDCDKEKTDQRKELSQERYDQKYQSDKSPSRPKPLITPHINAPLLKTAFR